jgi:hypothetical protein
MFMRRLRYWKESAIRSEALREEMELHLAEKAAELQEDGMTPECARAEARRRFGNIRLKHEESREIWMIRFWTELVQDVRYGLRTLVANKTFSAMAILSLALAIGANTAIYSFMDSILLRSLPVSDPDSLVVLNWRATAAGRESVMQRMSGSVHRDGSGFRAGIFRFRHSSFFRRTLMRFFLACSPTTLLARST